MLNKIIEHKRAKFQAKEYEPAELSGIPKSQRNFKDSLRNRDKISLIAELKKASPSKGLLDSKFEYLTIAKEYEQAGAAALSVITETEFFQGSLKVMREVSDSVSLPILRKDFLIHPSEVYEARINGADAVLLIAAVLSDQELLECQEIAATLNMDVLVEVHSAEELKRVLTMPEDNLLIGINNRNLADMKIDRDTTVDLSSDIPSHYVIIAESGYQDPEDLAAIKGKVDGVLIGTSLMQTTDKISKIKALLDPRLNPIIV